MRVILTHEQADFDALASLLGAHLLDETAIPVLPRKMNRNVRAFVTLYGVELPFIDPHYLPSEPVEAITLVDTQSMISLKGAMPDTRVTVIDHHPLREDLPAEWKVTTEDTGATVTLFVEVLRERGGVLGPIQATLLLLGIYEDTGSLTYTRTTSRDLRAAAFLVEQGANLGIASGFLNHPLSKKQQALYDLLRNHAQTLDIHGHTIVLSHGDAQDMDEELSTIAHKLRDLLDPDALLLLIKTRGGVQLIARSTNDNIDVSEITGHFGGGGHARAAAGLIRDRDVEDALQEMIEVLPRFVRPAITVSQIMSMGPQVLPPDTLAEEAARRMRRYGYEGYPVVEDGNVVGLLTRRDVDRSLSHNLNLTAKSLMQAGKVTVHPDDSIEHLQRVMTDTGWGQIPVTSPGTGRIIGIVTRTDLLKTLNFEANLPSRQNLAARLGAALPPARLALLKTISQLAHQQHAALYIVGGFVRDLLLDRPSLDFDLVVEGDAIALTQAVARRFGGRVASHSRFGTAKWYISGIRPALVKDLVQELELHAEAAEGVSSEQALNAEDLPDSLDFISARTEFYTHPTALPTVERGSIKLDLHRRDFTINTLALRLDGRHYGELHDYWGGLLDLRQGLVRSLHSLSFVDDPTRMLRAVRFEQRFNFRIEERTLQLLKEALTLIDRVSGDRIRHELDHILDEDKVAPMLARLDELALLHAIHPGLVWSDWLQDRIHFLHQTDFLQQWVQWEAQNADETDQASRPKNDLLRTIIFILWLVRLPLEQVKSIISRLKIPRLTADVILDASKVWGLLPKLSEKTPSEITRQLEEFSLLAVYGVFLATTDPNQRELLETFAVQWRKRVPETTGHELIARGLPRGPLFREILEALRAAWLDGAITSVEEEKAMLDEMIQSLHRGNKP